MFQLSMLASHFDVPGNRLYEIKNELLKNKKPFVDLVSGNVGAGGIQFPADVLKRALTNALRKTTSYNPDPLGALAARAAICKYYKSESIQVDESQVVLTPGTSLSYLYAFKVLANPGDEILIPTPSYPLFDAIAEICQVKLVPYKLEEGARWRINFEDMEARATARTKAIILISPHNPTGAVATSEEVSRLGKFAAEHSLAIISDEVFAPFVFTKAPFARPMQTQTPLVLTMNGFSKMLALPGMKIGWMLVTGDSAHVDKAMKALDMISDTFLPVNEMIQSAVPYLLNQSKKFQSAYSREIAHRRNLASEILGTTAPEGGFFFSLPIKPSLDEEEVVCDLLKKHRILVHPGYFYDMSAKHIVLNFVQKPAVLRKSLETIKRVLI